MSIISRKIFHRSFKSFGLLEFDGLRHQLIIGIHGDIIPLYLASEISFHQITQFFVFFENTVITTDRDLKTIAEAHARYVQPNLSLSCDVGIHLNRLDFISLLIIIEKWFDRTRGVGECSCKFFGFCVDSEFGHKSGTDCVAPKCERVHAIDETEGALETGCSFLDDWVS